jgi:hypothetical protein
LPYAPIEKVGVETLWLHETCPLNLIGAVREMLEVMVGTRIPATVLTVKPSGENPPLSDLAVWKSPLVVFAEWRVKEIGGISRSVRSRYGPV